MNESTIQADIRKKSQALMEKYEPYVTPLKESFKARGKNLDNMTLATVLNLLENLGQDMRIAESTQSVNVGTFIQHGYDLVTAIYPNLVANVVASTQPLASKSGEVWYYDLQYETAKGFVSANDPALSAKTGVRADKHYSSEFIDQTPTGAVNGINDAYSGTIPNAPLRTNAGTNFFTATDGVEIFTVDPTDFTALVGDQGGSGTLNVTTGAYTLTFNTAPVTGATLIATGKVYFETTPAAIGKTKIALNAENVYAEKHALITDYTLDAEHDLARNFNMNISDELIKGTAALIRAEFDQLVLDDILQVAKGATGAGSTTWSGAVPAGIAQLDHFRTLLTTLKAQSNDIYAATRMVHGNFVICGNDIATVLEVLPEFKANPAIGSELAQSGPYVAGTVGGFIVIKNPVYAATEWVVGNRGNTAFNTGYIIAPYKGLMVTGPVSDTDNPFSVTRGMWMEVGRKVVNSKFYAYGTATGLVL